MELGNIRGRLGTGDGCGDPHGVAVDTLLRRLCARAQRRGQAQSRNGTVGAAAGAPG